jgi:hypothetical protein
MSPCVQFAAVPQIREGCQDRGQGREGRDDRADFHPSEPGMFDFFFMACHVHGRCFFACIFMADVFRANQDRSEGVDYWDRASNMGEVCDY